MLPDKLKDWKYYYDKLPLYFKNDDRIEEHFHAIFDLSKTLSNNQDIVAKCFDVMADDYLSFINSYDHSPWYKDKSDILDKIASIYGVSRDFDISLPTNVTTRTRSFNFGGTGDSYMFFSDYKLGGCNVVLDDDAAMPRNFVEIYRLNPNGQLTFFYMTQRNFSHTELTLRFYRPYTYCFRVFNNNNSTIKIKYDVRTTSPVSLHLTNAELLALIKARIIQMDYDGSYKMAKQFYESVNLQVSLYTATASASANLYLIDDQTLTCNFIDMFEAGLFDIKSMGITYNNMYIDNLDDLFAFDLSDNHVFDVGLFL